MVFPAVSRVILTIAASAIVYSARADDARVWVEYPESGVVLGQGYNLLEDRPATGTCVDFVPIQDPSQSVQYRFDEVTSQTQVQSVTNISASGSMRMAILKASARLSFLSDETFKLETQKFLLSVNAVNSALFAAPSVDFKKGGAVVTQSVGKEQASNDYASYTKIAMKSDADRLNVEKCGQGFVAAIVSGASLDAFLTRAKTDARSLADIKGGLEADIGGIFTVSGSFQQKQTAIALQENTSVTVYKTGGNSSRIAYDLAGLKASVADMPLEAATAPKPIRVAILPYEYLDSVPEKKSYTAQLYGQAIAAFFLGKDVFQRTGNVVDAYPRFSELPAANQPIFLKDISKYLELNARALRSTNRLSTVLETCQQEVARGNQALGVATPPAEKNAAAQQVVTALGSAPADEGQRRNKRELADLSTLSTKLDDQFSKLTTAVDTARNKAVAELTAADTSTDAGIAADCSPIKEGSYLDLAVDEAIALAAEELSMRPIFWDDLGANYWEKLKAIAGKVGPKDSVEVMTRNAAPIFEEYHRLNRASRLIRETCQKTFWHPLCSVDYMKFLDRSALGTKEGEINFPQIEFDAK